MKHWGWAITLGAAATVGIASCSAKPPTAIVVAVSTEGRVPKEIDQVQITISRSGPAGFEHTYDLPADAPIPGTLTVESRDEADLSPVSVSISARKIGNPKWTILRNARLGFIEGHTKLLRMPLRYSCLQFPCPDGQSCVAGQCTDPGVDVASLPEFVPGTPVYVTTGGACFDKETCLDKSSPVVVEGDAASCSFPAPTGKFNLFMTWWTAPDNPAVVEQDGREGFSIATGRVHLAKGLCAAIFPSAGAMPRVVAVSVSTRCETKPADQPVCVPPSDVGHDAGAPDANGLDAGLDGSTADASAEGGTDASIDGGPVTLKTTDNSGAFIPAGSYPPATPPFQVLDVAPLGSPFPSGVPAIPQGLTQAGDVYSFTPHGTQFTQPVTVQIHYLLSLAGLTLLTAEPNASAWTMVPSTQSQGFLYAKVTAFSFFVVAGKPGVDAGTDASIDAPDDVAIDSPSDAADDAMAPTCSKPQCNKGTDADGGTFVAGCAGSCAGVPTSYQCSCASPDPASCFCSNGKSAPGCLTGSLDDCGFPLTCNADVSKDPQNCGYCGHDCGGQKCGMYGSCTPDTFLLGTSNPVTLPNEWASDQVSLFYVDLYAGTVNQVPIGGAAPGAPKNVIVSGQKTPHAIALNASEVFWRNGGDGTVWKAAKDGANPTQIGKGAVWFSGPSTYHTLAVDADSVYWTVEPSSGYGFVYSAPTGGGPTTILANDAYMSGTIGVDATTVYFTTFGGAGGNAELHSVPKLGPTDGGPSTLLASFPNDQLRDLLVTATGIYVTGYGNVYFVPLAGGTPQVVWDSSKVGSLAGPNMLAVDATALWWTDFVGGRVWTMPLAGGPARVFSQGAFEPGLLLLNAGYVIWEQSGGPALRLPKSAVP